MKWEKSYLGELVKRYGGIIQTGPFGSQLHQHDYKPEGIPVVMPKDIVNDRMSIDTIAKVSEEDADRLGKHKLEIGDLILPRRGDINKRAICKSGNEGWLCGTGCLKIRLNDQVVAPDYLFYYFSLSHVVKSIENKAVGATMLNLSGSILSATEIIYPPLPTQRRIASILSAYDDLIENNLRRIRLLEEKAFLRYRQVVREEELERKKLKDVLDLRYGKALKADNRKDGKYPVYGSSGEVGSHEDYLVQGPGIIVGRKGNIGSTFWSDENFWPIDTVYYVDSTLSFYYLYFNLKEQHFVNTDAAVPGLNRNFALDNFIDLPEKNVIEEFDQEVKSIFQLMLVLKKQNAKLREARDLLLPRLMSGEVAV